MEKSEQIKNIAVELLETLSIEGEVSVDEDESQAFRVHIETPETGLLIGFHGQTLESFQILLSLIVGKTLGSWEKVYVNVGDYREKREEALMYMAQRAADRAITGGRPVELSRLSPSERRVIHLTLSGDERVTTQSIGEGKERKLVISPKLVE